MMFHGCDGRWFAVQVRSKREFWISSILTNKGYEIYTPRYQPDHGRVSRARTRTLALLPGYIFCRFDSTISGPILTTPGVIRVVGFGKTPIPVNPEELEKLARAEKGGTDVRPHPFLTTGQRVRVEEGPLTGIEGIVITWQGTERLILSVNLLQRSVCVKLQRYRVCPI
jgi:transcription antitermination factor NusG